MPLYQLNKRLAGDYKLMKRKITGFHLDEDNDWVAELDCHHGQHVRHYPPFINRPWVVSETGRAGKLGNQLNCLKCDQNEPEDIWG